MAELIYSIERVFGDYLANDQLFNIPEYQRGYKWSNQQINQLLDDINDFETGGDDDLFYCLQNITLVLNAENKLNVVDGQQRLTTIALLLAFLKETERVKNKLIYAVRVPTNDFIQSILDDESGIIKDILKSSDFSNFLQPLNKDYDYQDIYFIYSAIKTFDKWFKTKENESKPLNRDAFKHKLLKNVKLIINRIDGVTEQELFMNLNAGKVQLDGSDLVRAIMITRVAKQEMEEFDSTEVKDVVRLNERRIRIGWELDELNAWWSKENVFNYFSVFTNLNTGEKETIKFDHKKHPINLLYKIWAESITNKEGKQSYSDLRLSYFETKNTNALDLYISIILLHRTLKDWFEDRIIYHYLGFLFSQKHIAFNTIWKEWNKKNNTRSHFVCFLKNELQKCVFGKEPNGESEDTGIKFWLYKIRDYNSEHPTNWYETPQLEKILLLLDIIEHSQEKKNGIPLPILTPRYFKNFNEDKEHIYPGTPKDIKAISILSNPEKSFLEYISKLNDGYRNDELIDWKFSANDWKTYSDEEKSEKLSSLKQKIHKQRPINSIGNLVLLHLSINRGFGNDYYTDKRMIVINNTENGEYVRQHTLKVFVKQTESNDLNNWTMLDITNNADKIHEKIKLFFDFNEKEISNE